MRIYSTSRPIDKHIGRQLLMHRTGRGLSCAEMGRAIGVTREDYAKIESGASRVPTRELLTLAQVLDIRLVDLFTGNLDISAAGRDGSDLSVPLRRFP
jgi:transcriptional regulator with XRE-family HTH domain